MEITDQLIRQFLAGGCTPDEADAVIAYLRLHPDRAASLLGEDVWKAAGGSVVTDHDPELVLSQLKDRLFPGERRRPVRRLAAWSAVAASLLLMVGGMIWLKKEGGHQAKVAAGDPVLPGGGTHAIDRVNATGRAERVLLPDGSTVILYGHSALHYTDSFGLRRRDISMEGRADFSVVRGVHPFSVLADRLETDVLGTSFGVRAMAGSVSIKLYSGKVLIRSVRPRKGWKDVVLSPGQEIAYDGQMLPKLRDASAPAAAGAIRDTASEAGDLVFNNSPLKHVFQLLSHRYNTKIMYSLSDLNGLNFTGTMMHTDSLDTFMQLIATINNLDIQQQSNGITVTRHKGH